MFHFDWDLEPRDSSHNNQTDRSSSLLKTGDIGVIRLSVRGTKTLKSDFVRREGVESMWR